MRLNAKCKSKTIIDHCRYIYRRCNIYDKALHKLTMHTESSLSYYKSETITDGNILQKAYYNPRILYRKSSINNMFEKANPNVALINPVH